MKYFIAVALLIFATHSGCGYIKDKATEKINEKIDNTIDENMRLIDSITDNKLKNLDSLSKSTGMSVDSLKAQIDSMSRITKEALKKNMK
ncbi:MAG TPA: hypothetical protein PKA90_01565 [Ignavibacteria bacterium]|nr:hypothetical protein [Ignavibacteria bacterium]HMR39094.1 hypothetical protein [Ignavibacteria bacterium]